MTDRSWRFRGHLTLIVGGVRSGKSRLAEEWPPLIPRYLPGDAQAGDADMARRIELHRQRRALQAPAWRTVEEPWDWPRW